MSSLKEWASKDDWELRPGVSNVEEKIWQKEQPVEKEENQEVMVSRKPVEKVYEEGGKG